MTVTAQVSKRSGLDATNAGVGGILRVQGLMRCPTQAVHLIVLSAPHDSCLDIHFSSVITFCNRIC